MPRWQPFAALLALGCSPLSAAAAGIASGGTGSPASAGTPLQISTARLSFAALGDTRPAKTCKSVSACGYPSGLIGKIYQQIQGLSPPVSLVVSTGDYQYNAPGDGTAAWQVMQQYLPAARQFRGPIYPAMGNHECNGFTDSNCTPEGPTPCDSHDACGNTENLAALLSMLGALGVPGGAPYYAVNVVIGSGLTAKFVFTAPNAWDSRQAAWLTAALTKPATYTFLVQHESNNLDETGASSPASLASIRAIVSGSGRAASGQAYPVTLWVVGHTHNFDYDPANQQVVIGLGGAPSDGLDNGEDATHFYRTSSGAFLLCSQQSSGDPPPIQCGLFDSKSASLIGGATTFAVNADGTPADVQ